MIQTNTSKSQSFVVTFTDRPTLSARSTTASIGSVLLGETPYPLPMTTSMLIPGNTLEFNPITLRILCTENMYEWVEVYKWMIACTTEVRLGNLEVFDRLQVTVLNLQNVPIMNVIYKDVWPTALGDILYSLEDEETTLGFDATFRFSSIEIQIIATGEVISYGAFEER